MSLQMSELLERRAHLLRIVGAVQNAIDGSALLRPHLRALDQNRTYLIAGAGKAAIGMARACADELPNARGLVVAQRASADIGAIRILAGAHPIPDERSVAAAQVMLDLFRSAGPDDEILFLLSGGASALMALPAPGLTLEDKREVTRLLLASGADIGEINCVRKHLSAIKGGRLSAATRARVRTFAISDVPGDDIAAIGSGPTVPDSSTLADARDIIARYGIVVPPRIADALDDPANESVKAHAPGALREFFLIGGPATALAAARAAVAAEGYEVLDLGAIAGEAREVAARHAREALDAAKAGRRVALISGGELSVTLGSAPAAHGGRCREYLLAFLVETGGDPRISAAAWDTDGIDGSADASGAVLLPDSSARASRLGLDDAEHLLAHRSGDFFSALGDSLNLGPQDSNVGDCRIVLIG